MKKIIPTVDAEVLDKSLFMLRFLPLGQYAKENGVVTEYEGAVLPYGTLLRINTYLTEDDDSGETSLVDVSYQVLKGIHLCESPTISGRVMMTTADIQKLLEEGKAYYGEYPNHEIDQKEVEEINKELEEKIGSIDDDEETDDNEEDDEYPDDTSIFDEADKSEEDEVDEETDTDDKDDEEDEGIDVSEMSPEEIRNRLNNRTPAPEAKPEIKEEKPEPVKEEPKKEEPQPEKKVSYVGAPEDMTSHKEPYKKDKKRDWEKNNSDPEDRKKKKKDKKKDKKKEKRQTYNMGNESDDYFGSIVDGLYD